MLIRQTYPTPDHRVCPISGTLPKIMKRPEVPWAEAEEGATTPGGLEHWAE